MNIRIEDLAKTDFTDVVEPDGDPVPPTSPGDILRHEFLEPLGMSARALGRDLRVPAIRITSILSKDRRVTGRHGFAPGALLRDDAPVLAWATGPV